MSTEINKKVVSYLVFYEDCDPDEEFVSGITIGQVDAILVDMNKKINQAVQDANDAVGDKIEISVPCEDFEVNIKK